MALHSASPSQPAAPVVGNPVLEFMARLRRKAGNLARRTVGWRQFGRVAYSQEGEDLAVARLLGEGGVPGFYVDIGAHHPFRYSNTSYFYQRGWRGINIDPAKGMKAMFERWRPRDINLEIAIAGESSMIEFLEFNAPELNGCDSRLAARRDGQNGHKIVHRRMVQAHPLREVLEAWLPTEDTIDFLTVDVEGLDLDVLASNDWCRWRPRIVVAEDAEVATTEEIGASKIAAFMRTKGYVSVSKLGLSLIFADEARIHRTELGVCVE